MRKRGAHFNRRLDPQAGLQAIAMLHGLDPSQQRDLGVQMRFSLEAIRTGRASQEDFYRLAACINTGLILCERGFGVEYLPAFKDAQAALLRLRANGIVRGRWIFDGGDMDRVLQGIQVHESQLTSISRKEADDAMREVMRRVDNGDVFDTGPTA